MHTYAHQGDDNQCACITCVDLETHRSSASVNTTRGLMSSVVKKVTSGSIWGNMNTGLDAKTFI